MNGEEQMDHQEWTLQCEDLSKEYQVGQAPCRAVQEVNLTLHKGEFLMIMGKSGGGKKHPDSNDGRAAFADKGQSVV